MCLFLTDQVFMITIINIGNINLLRTYWVSMEQNEFLSIYITSQLTGQVAAKWYLLLFRWPFNQNRGGKVGKDQKSAQLRTFLALTKYSLQMKIKIYNHCIQETFYQTLHFPSCVSQHTLKKEVTRYAGRKGSMDKLVWEMMNTTLSSQKSIMLDNMLKVLKSLEIKKTCEHFNPLSNLFGQVTFFSFFFWCFHASIFLPSAPWVEPQTCKFTFL